MLVDLNPPDAREQHLAGLQRCFPGWGDHETYRWAFERRVGGPAADVLLVESDRGVVAGTGVTYRQLRLPTDRTVLAAVMTGSWTLPEARGRGCFTLLVDEARRTAADRRAGLLLAFVTTDNASARRLVAAGAATFPTWYCSVEAVPGDAIGGWATPDAEPVVPIALPTLAEREARGHTRVAYPTSTDWAGQFADRPDCDVLRLAGRSGDGFAVVQHGDRSDRVQLLIHGERDERRRWLRSLRAVAARDARQLFLFTSRRELAEDCAAVGMATRDGWLTGMVADPSSLAEALGQDDQHPTDDGALADPASSWFLGPWAIHGGDRM